MLHSHGFYTVDVAALLFFFFSWACHYWIVHYSPLRTRTITHYITHERQVWMENMIKRNPKMMDVLIQNGLQQGVLFFASTSILIVGGLLAGLGATDEAIDILTGLPFTSTTTRTAWEIKVLLLLFIFVFSFFKFAWSHRQHNYVLIMIGSAPDPAEDQQEIEKTASRLSRAHALAAQNFTIGLNAYFFALAAFAWFLNAWLFIVATIWVSLVLYRRAFASRFVRILQE